MSLVDMMRNQSWNNELEKKSRSGNQIGEIDLWETSETTLYLRVSIVSETDRLWNQVWNRFWNQL
jgi:hypothetical protein